MQFISYSKTDLRKIRKSLGCSLIFLLFLLFFFPAVLPALDVSGTASLQDGSVSLKISVSQFPDEEILKALSSGHRSEITYNVRINKAVGFWRKLTGWGNVYEFSRKYNIRWDPLQSSFIIESEKSTYFEENSSDLIELLRNPPPFIITIDQNDMTGMDLSVKVDLIKKKLYPPLNILSIFVFGLKDSTEWTEVKIDYASE